MSNINDTHNKILECIKALTTPDNAEEMAKLTTLAGEMHEAYDEAQKQVIDAKDALVRIVTSTPIRQPTQDPAPTHDEPIDLDTLIASEISEVVKSRKP